MERKRMDIYVYTKRIDQVIIFTAFNKSHNSIQSTILPATPGIPDSKHLFINNCFEEFAKMTIEQGSFYLNDTYIPLKQISSNQRDIFKFNDTYYRTSFIDKNQI